MVVAIRIPRFELKVAAGGNEALLGEPVALAPQLDGNQAIGEVSPAAGAFGVSEGMKVGEALARCPRLSLVPADPLGARRRWEEVLRSLEGFGASVESPRPGSAMFESDGLLRLHGGLPGVLVEARRAAGNSVRIGVAPGPFAATQAAAGARPRRAVNVGPGDTEVRRFLSRLPVSAFASVEGLGSLPAELERLGLATLGQFASLARPQVADRFGRPGIEAHELANGADRGLRPRIPSQPMVESVELPESSGGLQLDHALDLLVRRLLAHPDRRARTIRSVALQASLEGSGSWCREVCFREATDDPVRMMLALGPVLLGITGPPRSLSIVITGLGPAAADQGSLIEEPESRRRERLGEAVRQSRAVAGPDAALRAVEVEADSRLPELRVALVPFEP